MKVREYMPETTTDSEPIDMFSSFLIEAFGEPDDDESGTMQATGGD